MKETIAGIIFIFIISFAIVVFIIIFSGGSGRRRNEKGGGFPCSRNREKK